MAVLRSVLTLLGWSDLFSPYLVCTCGVVLLGWVSPIWSGSFMAGEKSRRSAMDIKRLAGLLQRGAGRLLVIDSRTFSEYNASHVHGAVNVCCSKLVKRRLQQDKVSITELLQPNGKVKVHCNAYKFEKCTAFWLNMFYYESVPSFLRVHLRFHFMN